MFAIIPPEFPKLIVNSSGKYKYVFTYKNRWDKEAKHSTRGKGDTHYVGKLVSLGDRSDCGEIFFNDEFKAQYPALKKLRVLRYKGGRLEFKASDVEQDNVLEPGESSGCTPAPPGRSTKS